MKYDIYAIGNALVDMEFEINDKELRRLNVEKGVMILIDEKRHHYLINNLEGIKHVKASGGSAANSIITAQLLGAKTFYCSRIADDEYGNFFYHDLQTKGVTSNLNDNHKSGVTGKCIVMLTPDAERSMNTYLGIAEELSVDDLDEGEIAKSFFLYTEGYLVSNESTFNTALKAHQLAKKSKIKRATTLSDPNIVKYYKKNLKSILSDPVDLLFCNEKEAFLFCECQDITRVKEELQIYAKSFVITLGSRGSLAFDGHNWYVCEAMANQVIDTLGAGDTFAGAFMLAISRGFSYDKANRFANLAAGRIVSKFGPRINLNDAKFILSQMLI